MDTDAAFDSIRQDIAAGRTADVGVKVTAIADSTDDPFELIKCMSLLRVVEDNATMSELAKKLVSNLGDDVKVRAEIAGALRGLDYPIYAYDILKPMEKDDSIRRLSTVCLMDMEEYESANAMVQQIEKPVIVDRIYTAEIESSLGEHTRAVETSTALLADYPKDYDVMVCYVSTLILAGHDKDALKFGRAALKEKNADGNALAAYVMRVLGNVKAAGGYAARAVKMNPKHIGAMETLGICLAQKGEYDKARIVAGAINEASPGNRAALNVLSYCDDQN